MKQKQKKTQFVLILVGFFLILITYLYYPYINKNKLEDEQLAIQEDSKKIVENAQSTFENVEYEPEAFPGLVYRMDDPKVVLLLFGSAGVLM